MKQRNFSGATCEVKENLTSGAGAFFMDFDMATDLDRLADPTLYQALLSEKGLGATQGGGNFTATPVTRQIEVDGSDPITVYDGWDVKMTANILEIAERPLKLALGTGAISQPENGLDTRYKLIQANRNVKSDDYIENITWIVSKAGYEDPMIIQIFNAISESGININIADKENQPLAITFASMVDLCRNPEFADKAPFSIYDPIVKIGAVPTP